MTSIDRPLIKMRRGQTGPALGGQIFKADGTNLDITGATFTGVFADETGSNVVALTANSYSVVTAASGIFGYAQSSADMAVPGTYEWETKVTVSGKDYYVVIDLLIEPRRAP